MIRVLFVEDHQVFQRSLAVVLRQMRDAIEVTASAATLAQGHQFIGSLDEIDVAVIDLILPDGNGMELVRELSEVAPDLPVLVLTAVPDSEVHDMVKDLGANKVLTKQTSLKQIVQAIRELGEDKSKNLVLDEESPE